MDKENNQEFYNNLMTKKLAKKIIKLREEDNVNWKQLAEMIKEEFGDSFILEINTITGMYLEYAARDYLGE